MSASRRPSGETANPPTGVPPEPNRIGKHDRRAVGSALNGTRRRACEGCRRQHRDDADGAQGGGRPGDPLTRRHGGGGQRPATPSWLAQRLLDLDSSITDRLQPVSRILGETALEQPLDPLLRPGRQPAPIGFALENRRDHFRRRTSGERALAGQHLIEHAAEGPDVGAFIRRQAPGLLRAHVRRGSEDDADLRLEGGRRRHVGLRVRRPWREHFREAEVEDLHASFASQRHVGWLDVAVDDAAVVRGLDGISELLRNGQRLGRREAAVLQPLRQRLSVDELEDEKRRAAGFFEAVNRGNMRMTERRERLRLSLEPGDAIRVTGHRVGQRLDGDVTLQPGIAGTIDVAHPARAEHGENLVGTDPRAR